LDLPDIKKLKELLKLLRSQGVLQYQTTDLNLVLTERSPESTKSKASEIMEEEPELSPEEEAERILFLSADKVMDND
jgi:hypothetical protein